MATQPADGDASVMAGLVAGFGHEPGRGNRWILTGGIQSGKTTWLQGIVERLRQGQPPRSIGGVISPGVFHAGAQVACRGVCCRTGESFPLGMRKVLPDGAQAMIEKEFGGGCCTRPGQTVGSWLLFDEGLSRATDAVVQGVDAGCDLIVVDEFGPLEVDGGGLRRAVDHAVGAGAPLLLVVRETLVEPVQHLYGGFDLLRVPRAQ